MQAGTGSKQYLRLDVVHLDRILHDGLARCLLLLPNLQHIICTEDTHPGAACHTSYAMAASVLQQENMMLFYMKNMGNNATGMQT